MQHRIKCGESQSYKRVKESKKRQKGLVHLLVMLLLVPILLQNASPALAESESFEGMEIGAKSAILMEQSTGRILYEKDPHSERRIASITKIMTAILAIESGKMNKTVTVSDSILKSEGSAIYLQVGEKIKLSDLVYGLMLRSGNDAAIAIAEYVGGSVEGFAVMMNEKAKWLGMDHTHFTNPHGLDDSNQHFSSAYDMAVLTRYAMNNKQYRKIAGTKVHRAPNPNEVWDRVWKNKNKLLTQKYKYCTGGKTGYTKKANRTLVTTATKRGIGLIVVTIDDSTDWEDHISLYEAGFKDYSLIQLIPAGTIREIKSGVYKNNVYLKETVEYPLTKDEQKQVEIHYQLKKPKKKWKKGKDIPSVIGHAVITLNGERILTKPLYFKGAEQTFTNRWREMFLVFMGVKING